MSNETIKNYGKSIRSKLLNISKKEDVFHQTILTRFCFVVSCFFYKRSQGVDIVKGDIKSFSDCPSTDKCPLLFL